jgi:hypothetical protein
LLEGFFHCEHNYYEFIYCGRLARAGKGAREDSIAYLTTLSGNGGKRLGNIVDFLFSASTNAAHAAPRQGETIHRCQENASGKKGGWSVGVLE